MSDEENGDDREEYTEEYVKDILKEALKMRIKEQSSKNLNRERIDNALMGVLEEFLSCYMILGFDMDGSPIKIKSMHNKMEKSALDNQFMDEFGKFMSNRLEM